MKNAKQFHDRLNNFNDVTRKSILTVVVLISGMLNTNATNLKTVTESDTTLACADITKDEVIEIYDWFLTTTKGSFSGTALTLFDAKRSSNLVAQGEIILERRITNYFVLKSEISSKQNRIYFWEVQSEKGYAKGFSSNESSAKSMIHFVAKGDIISYRIIASGDLK